ncbi:MAG: matrixin family metalloprotease [Planctomycetota bacterium]
MPVREWTLSRLIRPVAVTVLLLAGASAVSAESYHVCMSPGCSGVGDTFHNAGGAAAGGEQVAALRFFNDPFSRWFSNFNASSFTGVRGDGITLTYGVVPDGTTINGTAVPGESASDTSNLVSFLNTTIGSPAIWQGLIDDAYQRWGELSGLNMVRENNDDGAAMGSGGARGQNGVRADMRIGGRFLDGQSGSNTLAYNYSPINGDHVVDTSNTFFYGNSFNNYRAFRNVFMHEAGHGLGLAHVIPTNGSKIMEPFINTGFDGPQHDDILAIQRQYGDRFETGSGNDFFVFATDLGTLSGPVGSVSIGTDANDNTSFVGANEFDFVSIDGTTDIDVYGFSIDALSEVTLDLNPTGPTYQEGPEGGSSSSFNTKALNDLMLELIDASGSVLATADNFFAGVGESIFATLAAGDYFARVRVGSTDVDNIQIYRLDVIAEIADSMILGDYNNDGFVDSADYTVWSDLFGTLVEAGTSADGNGDGVIDAADYTVWADSFGDASGVGLAGFPIPEPTSMLLLVGFGGVILSRRRAA